MISSPCDRSLPDFVRYTEACAQMTKVRNEVFAFICLCATVPLHSLEHNSHQSNEWRCRVWSCSGVFVEEMKETGAKEVLSLGVLVTVVVHTLVVLPL